VPVFRRRESARISAAVQDTPTPLLTVELDLERVNAAQRGYLDQRTRAGTQRANRVRVMRDILRHAAGRFGERQLAAVPRGGPLLEDGRQETLEDALFGPLARQGWPRRAAAVLHGLHLPATPLLPATACCKGGPGLSTLDPASYRTRLDDGPAQARELGDTTALAVYLHPLRQLRILWIGAESDHQLAVARLRRETRLWTDWRPVSPDYADWLEKACKAAQAS